MFNINPKQMEAAMKKMGIKQEEISCSKVEIFKDDGSKLIIEPASVTRINMQGQDSFQIAGEVREEGSSGFSEEDIESVMEKTNCSREEAENALEETGDLAEAILKLTE